MTTVVAAVIRQDRKILVCRRSAAGSHPLKWEFPGGKVEVGESPAQALGRELREELAIEAEIGPEIARYEYAYPGKNPISLIFYRVESYKGTIENRIFDTVSWASTGSLGGFDFLEGDAEFVRRLTAEARAES